MIILLRTNDFLSLFLNCEYLFQKSSSKYLQKTTYMYIFHVLSFVDGNLIKIKQDNLLTNCNVKWIYRKKYYSDYKLVLFVWLCIFLFNLLAGNSPMPLSQTKDLIIIQLVPLFAASQWAIRMQHVVVRAKIDLVIILVHNKFNCFTHWYTVN